MGSQVIAYLVPLFLALAFVNGNGAPAEWCENHGSVTCECNQGYNGAKCSNEIDFCNSTLGGLSGGNTVGNLCDQHGRCVSTTVGAHCVCDHGFTGPFCQTNIANETTTSQRCALYSTPDVIQANLTIGCPTGERCLSDDLNCGFQYCKFPIGWCLPAKEVESIQNDLSVGFHAVDPNDPCSGHGQATCHCFRGYYGDHCQYETDFCNETCNAFENGETCTDICGPHGICSSTVAGASCECKYGWTGPLCNNPIPNEVTEAKRCVLRNTTQTLEWSVIGCAAAGQRCLTDDLNCGFQYCAYPIGWCLPEHSVSSVYSAFKKLIQSAITKH